LFFLRFTHKENSSEFKLTKELHITQQQAPHANKNNEHYCRRWTSIKTIQNLEKSTGDRSTFGIQVSSYENQKNEYLVLSSATTDPFKKEIYRSVSIGMLLSPQLKKKLNFFDENTFNKKSVGVTCETCSIKSCKERVAEPLRLEKQKKYSEIADTVANIMNSYS
jgi:hypothetical protein